jgi:hypothetical protein
VARIRAGHQEGQQAITCSKGLRRLLAVAERTDEEIAAEDIGGEDLAVIHGDNWQQIARIPRLPALVLVALTTAV